jgi:hypothetical protein
MDEMKKIMRKKHKTRKSFLVVLESFTTSALPAVFSDVEVASAR